MMFLPPAPFFKLFLSEGLDSKVVNATNCEGKRLHIFINAVGIIPYCVSQEKVVRKITTDKPHGTVSSLRS
jgi:hypothetical protein